MDDDVLVAMAKWPNVPAVFGWLQLSARGDWRIKGELIGNVAIRDFIARNYAGDERGRWYFQNGPQRVYVALEATPWVLRLDRGVTTHTGLPVRELREAVLLDDGRVVLVTEHGAGIVDDRDMAQLADALTGGANLSRDSRINAEALGCTGGELALQATTLADCERRYHFVREPT